MKVLTSSDSFQRGEEHDNIRRKFRWARAFEV